MHAEQSLYTVLYWLKKKKVQFQKWDAKINYFLKKIYIHHSGHDLTSILQFFSDFLVRTV